MNFGLTFLFPIFVQMRPALSWVTCASRKHEVYDPVCYRARGALLCSSWNRELLTY